MSSNDNIENDIDLSDVIPNPNRQKKPQVAEQEETNYARLNIKPQTMPARYAAPAKKSPSETVSVVNNTIVKDDEEGSIDQVDINAGWIDNNDFVFPPDKTMPQDMLKHRGEKYNPTNASPTEPTTAPILGQPRVGEYILMVSGKIVDTGSLSLIEGSVRAILYGEKEDYINKDIRESDIVILKRVPIQVGIFVDRE